MVLITNDYPFTICAGLIILPTAMDRIKRSILKDPIKWTYQKE